MKTSKTTKRALLSSVLALVLCFAMLLGTTFAWFTDTASTSVNKIQAGTLDVALEMADGTNTDGTTKWVSAEGKTLNFVKHTSDTRETILWEPGCTYKLPTVRIKNNGNLALKYKVLISAVNGDTSLANVLDVYLGENKVGTLADVLSYATSNFENTNGYIHGKLGTSESDNASDEITLSLHMQETAGNEYQGKSIEGIAITVLATQDTVEYDSNNNTYDAGATYPDYVPATGLDTSATTTDATVGTVAAGNVFTSSVDNVYQISGGNYAAAGTLATFDESYGSVLIEDTDVSCKTLIELNAPNTIILENCNITIAEGGYLVKDNTNQLPMLIFANVTINGEKVTDSNLDTIKSAYLSGNFASPIMVSNDPDF